MEMRELNVIQIIDINRNRPSIIKIKINSLNKGKLLQAIAFKEK
jgi:hypothetical protein